MMSFPLILCAKPVVGVSFPTVRLSIGKWRITHDARSSKLQLLINDQVHTDNVAEGDMFTLTQESNVQCVFTAAGSEYSITVFAERIG